MHFSFWFLKDKIDKKRKVGLTISCMIVIVLELILMAVVCLSKFPYTINMLSYAIPYFSGVVIAQEDNVKKVLQNKFVAIVAIGIYTVGCYHFSFYNTGWTTQVLRIGLSECVIVIVMYLKEKFEQTASKVGDGLSRIGQDSLAIYLLHWPFMDYKTLLIEINSSLVAGVMSILLSFAVVVICIVIKKFLCELPYMGPILFGETGRKSEG